MHRDPKIFHNEGAAGVFRPLFLFLPFTICSFPVSFPFLIPFCLLSLSRPYSAFPPFFFRLILSSISSVFRSFCLFLFLYVLSTFFRLPLMPSFFSSFFSSFPFSPFLFSHASVLVPLSPSSSFPSVFPDTVPPVKRGPGPVPGHAFLKSKTCIMPITYIPLPFFLRIHTRIQNTYIQKTPRKNITTPTEKTTIPETTPRAQIRIYGNTEAEKTGRNDRKTSLMASKIIVNTKTLCPGQRKM